MCAGGRIRMSIVPNLNLHYWAEPQDNLTYESAYRRFTHEYEVLMDREKTRLTTSITLAYHLNSN